MYDPNKRIHCNSIKVGELAEFLLSTFKYQTEVTICGSNEFYIHSDKEDTVVTLDTENLNGDYEADAICPFEFYDVFESSPITTLADDIMESEKENMDESE